MSSEDSDVSGEQVVLVPATPSAAHIESMAYRLDHGHGIKRSFPTVETDDDFRKRQEANRSTARQMYEEATGQGFFKVVVPEPLEGTDSSLIKALGDIRDMMPEQEINSRGDQLFVEAMALPEAVPALVEHCITQLKAKVVAP